MALAQPAAQRRRAAALEREALEDEGYARRVVGADRPPEPRELRIEARVDRFGPQERSPMPWLPA